MSRNYSNEFQEAVWNQLSSGGVNFSVLTKEFFREGLPHEGETMTDNHLYSGGVLSILHCFAAQPPKFDSQYPEGDARRTDNIEGKIVKAIKAATIVLREFDPAMLAGSKIVVTQNTPALIRELFAGLEVNTEFVQAPDIAEAAAPADVAVAVAGDHAAPEAADDHAA